jgi:glucose-6-phosphate isomerase
LWPLRTEAIANQAQLLCARGSSMSSNKFTAKFAAIRLDSSGAFIPSVLSRDDHVAIVPQLEAARRAVLMELEAQMPEASRAASGDLRQWVAGAQRAEALDQNIALPERMLADYRRQRRTSELGRILAVAKRLREAVDRVVVVGSEDDCSAARALFEACCHPYHNEQGRGDRGGRPRIYFAGSDLDNDALQGLLDMLPHERAVTTLDERWGMIVIDAPPTKSGNAEDAVIAERTTKSVVFQVLFEALWRSCGGDPAGAAELAVMIARPPVGVHASACGDTLTRELQQISVFSSAGLLPASVMGLDIVRLLEGAAAMNERFRTAPIGDNPPLDLAGVFEQLKRKGGAVTSRFVPWGRGLAAAANWCQRLSDGITNLNSEKSNPLSEIPDSRFEISDLTINLIVESVRRDRIAIASNVLNDDPLTPPPHQILPDIQTAAISAAKAALAAAGRPAIAIRLPALDESSLGQLFQMMALSLRVLGVLRVLRG